MDLLIEGLQERTEPWKQSAGSRFICVDADEIRLDDEAADEATLEHVQFEPGESVVLSNGFLIETSIELLDSRSRLRILRGEPDPAKEATLALPAEGPLEIRGWRPGDRFRPLGAPGTKKLKDWFIDRGVPRRERRRLPVVTTLDGEVIWVPGFPPAEGCKINGRTKQALRLTYRPRNPR